MSAQHTPGPWRHEWTNGAKETFVVVPVDLLQNGSTAIIGCCSGRDKEANARLIAAAPELLAACQLLIAQYDESGDFTMGGKLTNQPFTLARAAIAKATGHQPLQGAPSIEPPQTSEERYVEGLQR